MIRIYCFCEAERLISERMMCPKKNEEWIEEIVDLTPLTKKIRLFKKAGKYKEAKRLLPKEKRYELPEDIAKTIGA